MTDYRLRYRRTAVRDLEGLRDHYDAISTLSRDNVFTDLQSTLLAIKTFPDGYRSFTPGVRTAVTVRYRFKIVYRVHPDTIEIIYIYRFQERPVSS